MALARSIAPRPGVLLMDEPFSNLDRRMRDAIRDETVAILRETGATTIVVTHDPEEAMRIADRIVLMRAGAIVQEGSAEEIYRAPVDLFAARFFCDFNEVEGVVRNGRWSTPVGVFAGARHLARGTPSMCIRPQGGKLRRRGLPAGARRLAPLPRRGRPRPYRRAGLDGRCRRVRNRIPPGARDRMSGVDIDPDEVLVFAAGDP